MCTTNWAKGHNVSKCWTFLNNAIQTSNVVPRRHCFHKIWSLLQMYTAAQKLCTGKISFQNPISKVCIFIPGYCVNQSAKSYSVCVPHWRCCSLNNPFCDRTHHGVDHERPKNTDLKLKQNTMVNKMMNTDVYSLGHCHKGKQNISVYHVFSLNVGAHEKTCMVERKVLHFDFIRHISGTIWGLEKKRSHMEMTSCPKRDIYILSRYVSL